MHSSKTIFLLVIIGNLTACGRSKQKYPYAIKDFDASLQPYLTKIVSAGIIKSSDSVENYVQKRTSIKELKRLAHSEHPVLRTVAVQGLLNRKEADPFETLMTHLDDTAYVTVSDGRVGYLEKVSDVIIQNGTWASEAQRQITIDKLITEHNYLKSAYEKLFSLSPEEKYYPYIKQMAESRWHYFEEIEKALYALAKFKKEEDILFIKNKLMNVGADQLSGISFSLMRKYPHDAYFEVLKRHFDDHLNPNVKQEYRLRIYANGFFETVSVYKNKEAAAMLEKGLELLSHKDLDPWKKAHWKEVIVYAIWNNKCDAYKELRKRVTPEYSKMEKEKAGYPEIIVEPGRRVSTRIRWWD